MGSGNVLFLLNMTLEAGNSAPSVHLMTGIIEAVAESGDSVHIITRHYAGEDGDALKAIKQKYDIRHYKIDVPVAGRANIAKRYLNDLTYFRKAARLMKEFSDIQAVFVQSCVNPAAAVHYARKACPKARIIYNVQDIYSEAAVCRGLVTRKSLLFKVFAAFESKAYKGSDLVITVSEGMAETIRESGCDASKVQVIHNWTYTDTPIDIPLSDNAFLKDNGLDDGKFKVVYAGNIGALQDVETLVQAAKILKNHDEIEFVIVGDGLRVEQVRATIDSEALSNVRYFGRQPSDVVEQVYSLADLNVISLIPGMTRAALPSKTAICLSCGTTILLSADTDSEYAKQMGATGNCIVCEPKDAQALADSILEASKGNGPKNRQGSRELFRRLFCGSDNRAKYRELILG